MFCEPSNGVTSRRPCSITGSFLQQRLESTWELRTKQHLRSSRPAQNHMALQIVSEGLLVSRPIILCRGCVWVWSRHQLGEKTSEVLDFGATSGDVGLQHHLREDK
jgi:hypothetical protein